MVTAVAIECPRIARRAPEAAIVLEIAVQISREEFRAAPLMADLTAMPAIWRLAEGVGFEPTVSLHPRRFSRPLP